MPLEAAGHVLALHTAGGSIVQHMRLALGQGKGVDQPVEDNTVEAAVDSAACRNTAAYHSWTGHAESVPSWLFFQCVDAI